MKIIQVINILFLINLFFAKNPAIENENGILVLQNDNFKTTLKKNDYLLVLFYAPYCPHSQKLLPEFEKASEILSKEKIILAKVDASSEKTLSERYQIQAFPIIKLFLYKNENEFIDYTGPRNAIDIITWARKKTGSFYSEINTENEFLNFQKENKVFVVYFGANNEEISLLKELSMSIDEFPFVVVNDKNLMKKLNEKNGKFVLYKNFDEKKMEIPKKSEKVMETVIYRFGTEKFFIFDDRVSSLIFTKKIPGLFLFSEQKDLNKYETLLKNIKIKIGNKIKLILVNINDEFSFRLLEYIGIDKKNIPIIKILDTKNFNENKLKRYTLKQKITENNILDFIDKWVDEELKPEIKSKPIPSKNNENVFILVGNNYKKEVIENNKDVMVLFYAPWCGHCKSLFPIYNDLAKKYNKMKDKIIFAKIDATENEVEGVEIDGIPTLLFYAGNKKNEAPIEYEGNRTLKQLEKFIKKNASNDINLNKNKKEQNENKEEKKEENIDENKEEEDKKVEDDINKQNTDL